MTIPSGPSASRGRHEEGAERSDKSSGAESNPIV